MKYAVYKHDDGTGLIVQEGGCPRKAIAAQANGRPGCRAVAVAAEVSMLTHRINYATGLAEKMTASQRKRKQDALDEFERGPAVQPLSRIERILAHLKKQGVDLGPAGADL